VEANPQLASQIPKSDSIQVFNYAISGDDEDVVLNIHKNSESSSTKGIPSDMKTGEVQVPGQTLDTFLSANAIASVDLLKVDIEGAEVPLFNSASDASLERISQIVIEFHDFLGLINASDVARIVERLRGAGFYPIKFSHSNMNWLFVRLVRCRVSLLQRAYAKYVFRYVRGLVNKFGLLDPA
jgi:FkbM family methyltransferase